MLEKIVRTLRTKELKDYKRVGYELYKDVYYLSPIYSPKEQQKLLFILGCQRSGSSMMYEIFTRDSRSKVFGEFSKLNSEDTSHNIRLNPLPKVAQQLASYRHPLIVIKPIVESQNVLSLLQYFNHSKAVWLFRHYRDVAKSNIKKWGDDNGYKNIQYFLSRDQRNWRAQHVSDYTFKTVKQMLNKQRSPYDYAALFWWVRNRFYIEYDLSNNKQIFTCQYENLVSKPLSSIESIYDFMGLQIDASKVATYIHNHSVGKGEDAFISNDIAVLCDELLDLLIANADNYSLTSQQ